jgi:hypothetical protein
MSETEDRHARKRKLLVLNVGLAGGVIASIFMVPARTPLWLWGLVCGLAVVAINCALLISKGKEFPPGRASQRKALLIIAMGLTLLLLDLLFGHFLH